METERSSTYILATLNALTKRKQDQCQPMLACESRSGGQITSMTDQPCIITHMGLPIILAVCSNCMSLTCTVSEI